MDIITATIVSITFTLAGLIVTHRSLGLTKVAAVYGGNVIAATATVASVALNCAIYWALPEWAAWALAVAHMLSIVWSMRQARQAQRLTRELSHVIMRDI